MKTFLAGASNKRSAAMNCLLINQLATPGLGSLAGRRISAGIVQLSLALVGFGLFVGWFIQKCAAAYRMMSDLPPQPPAHPWLGKAGAAIFFSSWLLAWFTSISLLREARQNKTAELPCRPLPPKLR